MGNGGVPSGMTRGSLFLPVILSVGDSIDLGLSSVGEVLSADSSLTCLGLLRATMMFNNRSEGLRYSVTILILAVINSSV